MDAARTQAQAETEQTLAAAKIKGEAAGEAVLMGAKREAANLVADAKSRMDAAAAGIVAKIKGGEGD